MIRPEHKNFTRRELVFIAVAIPSVLAVVGVIGWLAYGGATCGVAL